MNRFETGCLIVIREGKAVGRLIERDLLRRMVRETKAPNAKSGGRSYRRITINAKS